MTKHAASVTEPNDRRWTSPTIQIASAGWPGFILGAPHGHLTAGLSSLLRSRPSLFRRMSCDASSHAGSLSDSATWSLRRKRPLPANHNVVEAVVEEGGRPASGSWTRARRDSSPTRRGFASHPRWRTCTPTGRRRGWKPAVACSSHPLETGAQPETLAPPRAGSFHSTIAVRPAPVIRRYATLSLPALMTSRCVVARPACTNPCNISNEKPRAIMVDSDTPRGAAAMNRRAACCSSVIDMREDECGFGCGRM
jgi:hypothetical protein